MPDTFYVLKHGDSKWIVMGFDENTGAIMYHWEIKHARRYGEQLADRVIKDRPYLRKVKINEQIQEPIR